MQRRRRQSRTGRERGAALLLVLMVFMVLGVLALDFGKYMRDDAMAGLNMVEETRGYYAAIGCMNATIYNLLVTNELSTNAAVAPDLAAIPVVPGNGIPQRMTFGDYECDVRMTHEAAKIAINGIDPAFLQSIVENLVREGNRTEGLDRREVSGVETIVNSIIDWQDRDDLRTGDDGAESDYYLGLTPSYRAKNARIDSIEELILVRGVTADLVYGTPGRPGLRDVFTVWGHADSEYDPDEEEEPLDPDDPPDPELEEDAGDEIERAANVQHLDLQQITPAVLQALLGVDREIIDDLMTERLENPLGFQDRLMAEATSAGVGPFVAQALGLNDDIVELDPEDGGIEEEQGIVTIEARADARQERNQARVAAVIDLDATAGAGDQIMVKRWYDRAPWSLEGLSPDPNEGSAG